MIVFILHSGHTKSIRMCVFGLVLEEPFRDQIQRRFDVDASEEPVLPEIKGATCTRTRSP